MTITLDGTSTGCTLNAGVISFTAGGTCVVDANQAGNANWNAAAPGPAVDHRQQGQPDRSRSPSTNPSPVRRRRHLHPDGHGHLGAGGHHHPRRNEHRLHLERRWSSLHRGGHLHDRRQPGRQRQLERGQPRSSSPSPSTRATRPSRSLRPTLHRYGRRPSPRRPRPPRGWRPITLDGRARVHLERRGVASPGWAPVWSTPTRPATPTGTRQPRSSSRSPSTRATRPSPSRRPTPRR